MLLSCVQETRVGVEAGWGRRRKLLSEQSHRLKYLMMVTNGENMERKW